MNNRVYEAVTAQVTNALMRGVVPWRKPWSGGGAVPTNARSRKPYRGVNVFLLSHSPYTDHRWITFQQAKELGGTVKRGERASPVVFWKPWRVEGVDQETGEILRWNVPLLKQYHVFNVEQCESLYISPLKVREATRHDRIERAEALLRAVPDPPRIQEQGTSAWYRPDADLVQVPPIDSFDSADEYYETVFHEVGHSTGHEKRLNRASVTGEIQFGSACYSREELIAELTSAFCCATIGLDNSLIENAASYIQSWLSALRSDPRAMVVAASKAQKAADYIMGVTSDDQPV
ncbi:MAG: DUF1738 domain-containing protein [Armatimonadetes bacterium]|nr:DUF1738 domain-containing protein [Armatimonadota bacterium]